ncbi:MAG: hypothetical protein M1319_03460 [Chloroflexi bacterium]|nr:hypothetical protein [Chloroflexota bacterium]
MEKRDVPEAVIDGLLWALPWAFIVLLLASLPYLAGLLLAPRDAVFTGLIINPADGNSYLAKMAEGASGAWLFHLPFTSEPHNGAFLFPFYLALGRLCSLVGIPLIAGYHAARLFGGLVLLLVGYQFLGFFLPGRRQKRIAYLLLCFASGQGWIFMLAVIPSTDLWLPESNAFYSILVNPHFPLAVAAEMGSFLFLARFLESGRTRFALASGSCGLVLTLLQPFMALSLCLIAGIYTIIRWWYRARDIWADLRGLAVVLVMTVASAGYAVVATSADPVLSAWMAQNLTPSPGVLEFVSGYGALGLLGFWGGVVAMRSRQGIERERILLLIVWVVVTAVLLYAPLSLQRRLSEGLQVPLVILAAIGLSRLSGFPRLPRRLLGAVAVVMLVPTNLALVVMATGTVAEHQYPEYIGRDELAAMEWLHDNTRPADVVLASSEMGNTIPARAGNTVYYGHLMETIDSESKLEQVEAFYGGGMTAGEAAQFLDRTGVRYVFWSEYERELGGRHPDSIAGVSPAFTSGDVTVFRVTK